MYYNYIGFPLNCIPGLLIGAEPGYRNETHNDKVFAFSGSSISVTEREASAYDEVFSPYMTISTNMSNNLGNVDNTLLDFQPQKMKVVRNRLFVSDASLEYIYFSGMQRQGLAVFCLEPKDVFEFTDFDTTICEGDTALYSIPAAEYAEGY